MSRPFRPIALALFVTVALAGGVLAAQEPPQSAAELAALKKEIQDLKVMLLAVQKDVQETKAILQKVTQPQQPRGPVTDAPSVEFSVAGAPAKGSRGATVAVIEFSDYQCPFCSRYATQTWPQVNKDYVESGKVQYFFVNYPIEQIHPHAFKAHEAASCAAEQGKYWEMHDRLFGNQSLLAPAELTKHAAAIGLDMAKFQPCLDSGRTADLIRKDLARSQKIGVTGTPAFLIGTIEPNGTTVKGLKMIAGAQPFTVLKPVIDEAIAGKK
jgi:protein-disulfide isomerase